MDQGDSLPLEICFVDSQLVVPIKISLLSTCADIHSSLPSEKMSSNKPFTKLLSGSWLSNDTALSLIPYFSNAAREQSSGYLCLVDGTGKHFQNYSKQNALLTKLLPKTENSDSEFESVEITDYHQTMAKVRFIEKTKQKLIRETMQTPVRIELGDLPQIPGKTREVTIIFEDCSSSEIVLSEDEFVDNFIQTLVAEKPLKLENSHSDLVLKVAGLDVFFAGHHRFG